LYRAIDQNGNVVDAMLSEKRNMEAAQRFFQQAVDVLGRTPEQVRTVEAAARFCGAFDELRTYLRPRRTMSEVVSLLEQRQTFLQRLAALQTVIQAAS
jgi:putative transposase